MVVPGTCRLCRSRGELVESHIVPRWAYKRLHGEKAKPTQPVQMIDGVAVQKPDQVKEHLLCRSCEQAIGDLERPVAGMVAGSHPFRSLLPNRTWDAGLGVWQADASSVDHVTICKFAISVFWRASVASCLPEVRLGPYEETCRRYVAGDAPFPRDARLLVKAFESSTPEGHPLMEAIRFPEAARQGGCHLHVTLVCGLEFLLAVGGRIPAAFDLQCLHHARTKRIMLVSGGDDPLTSRIRSLSLKAEARGVLARKGT